VVRFLLLVVAWLARIVLYVDGNHSVVALVADLTILAIHYWATVPLRRKVGAGYGLRPSWTFIVEIPMQRLLGSR